jgi:aminobenzoyl-glutamate utilization protein B
MQNAHPAWSLVEARKDAFEALSDRIWDTPELGFLEHRAAAEHAAMLAGLGFEVRTGIAGMPTAVVGEAGAGGPVIAILGEFDALPGLSQQAGVAGHQPVEANGPGHGCGHNLLGAGAMLAAAAVADWLATNGVAGRVRYLGCPAEENGGGKLFLVRDGVFDDVDVAVSWHPAPVCGVNKAVSLANVLVDFDFTGRPSHAAAAPQLGRSALDAVELMNVGVNYMREHMPADARIHYALLDAGGVAPNVVQGRAKVRYVVRARELPDVHGLLARVVRIAEGAALMTETTMRHKVIGGMSNLLGNAPLERAMQDNLERLGPPPFDEADRAFARQIQATLKPEDIAATFRRFGLPERTDVPLCDVIAPLDGPPPPTMGSTDVGDVSWVVPTVQARGATCAMGTPGHSWQMTAQGKSPAAHKGMVHVAKIMAATAIDVIGDAALLAAARADHAGRIGAAPYRCPVAADVPPALDMALGR